MSAVIGVGVSIAAIQGMLAAGGVAAAGTGAWALYIATECQRSYGRFQRVYEEWMEICGHGGMVDQAAIDATEKRTEALRSAYEAMRTASAPRMKQIDGVMKQIESEAEFLRSEIARLRHNALERRTGDNARADYRRQASSLLKLYADALPEGVCDDLRRATMGVLPEDEMERILRHELDRSAEAVQTDSSSSTGQQKIISVLHTAEPLERAAKWLADRKNPAQRRMEAYVAELELFYPERASAFAHRIAELERCGYADSLMRDSLALDLRESVESARLAAQAAKELRQIADDIRIYAASTGHSDDALAWTGKAEQALSTRNVQIFGELAEEGHALLEDTTRRLAAACVRQEILASLAELGYEVEESSAAMWQENGRLVVRDRSASQYGVEVGGDAAKRLQFRLVGLTGDVDARRDYKMEAAWCDTFERLRENLSEQGTDLLVENKVQPGEIPLKRFADTAVEQRAPSQAQAKYRRS